MIKLNLKIKNLLLFIATIVSFYLLKLDFINVNWMDFLFLVFITIITDNIKIYWKNNRLISNMPAFLYAFILGPEYLLISCLIIIFSQTKHKELSKKIYRVLVFSTTYSVAALISYSFSTSFSLFSLLLFVSVSKLLNYLIVDLPKKVDLSFFLFEYLIFLSFIPYSFLYLYFSESIFRYFIFLVNLFILLIFYAFINLLNQKSNENIKSERLRKLNEVIINLGSVLKDFSLKIPPEQILDKIGDILHDELGYSYVLISLFDFDKKIVRRVTQKGLSKEVFEKIQNQEVPVSEVNRFFRKKYKYKEIYFIPQANLINDIYTYQPRENIDEDYFQETSNKWDPDDLLLLSLRDEKDRLIGYISLDGPENNLKPTKEEMNILSVFAEMVSLVLTHSQKFLEIKNSSEKDGLTGVYNHSKLFLDLEEFEKEKVRICLIFFDIDNFKAFNDTYGHEFGDWVLTQIANILQNNTRNDDRVYRYGGDEFVLILKNIFKKDLLNIVDRIFSCINEMEPKISVSSGCCCSEEKVGSYTQILNKADERMYKAKKEGKRGIIFYE